MIRKRCTGTVEFSSERLLINLTPEHKLSSEKKTPNKTKQKTHQKERNRTITDTAMCDIRCPISPNTRRFFLLAVQ